MGSWITNKPIVDLNIENELAYSVAQLCHIYGIPNTILTGHTFDFTKPDDEITKDAEFEIIEPKQLPPVDDDSTER